MKKKIAYAVTTNGWDEYAAMTRVSVTSVRLSNPTVETYLVCDSKSLMEIKQSKSSLPSDFHVVIGVETPEGNSTFRNRYVKTRLRELMAGPFLFLDSDILVRGALDEIFSSKGDIAAVFNHCSPSINGQVWAKDLKIFNDMGWELPNSNYFNGGVIFYSDSYKAKLFGSIWHEKWRQSNLRLGLSIDQPALYSAQVESGVDVSILPDAFNAQFIARHAVARDAVVWHYYSSKEAPIITGFEALVADLVKGGAFDESDVRRLMRQPLPWRREFWLDDFVNKRLEKSGRLSAFSVTWLQGARVKACVDRLMALFKKA